MSDRAVSSEVRRRAVRRDDFPGSLTEALLVVVRVATRNVYIRRIAESVSYSAHAADESSKLHGTYRELWGGMLAKAKDQGEIASDLSIDAIVSWLSSAEAMLMARVDAADPSDDDLRYFIRASSSARYCRAARPRAKHANSLAAIKKRCRQ